MFAGKDDCRPYIGIPAGWLQWGPALFAGKDDGEFNLKKVDCELQWGPALFAGKDGASRLPPGLLGSRFNGARLCSPGKTLLTDSRTISLEHALQWGPALFAGKDRLKVAYL